MKMTKSELYLLNDLLEAIDEATSLDAIEQSIKLIDTMIDVDSSILTAIEFNDKGMKTSSAIFRFPKPWVKRYVAKRYAFIDPVAQAAIAAPGIVHDWSDAFLKRSAPSSFIGESREHGLQGGVVMGFQTDDFLSQYSVVANSQKKAERKRLNGIVRIITPRLHEAMRRVAANPLSPREIEVLNLISRGATNIEVSKNVSPPISYDTVLQHVKSIKRKLGASNIQHAVYIATKIGFLR